MKQGQRELKSRQKLLTVALVALCTTPQFTVKAFSVLPPITRCPSSLCMSSNGEEDQAVEALRSLIEFHEGNWKGQATSFTVTADVAAGIVQRRVSPEYKSSVRIGMDRNGGSMTETYEFDDKMSSRCISLVDCHMDVDSVDASYSLDTTLPELPSAITGTEKLLQFGIEHCIAVSDVARIRCMAFYNMDQALARVVVLSEEKAVPSDSALQQKEDIMSLLSQDVDRIVDKISGQVVQAGNNTGTEDVSIEMSSSSSSKSLQPQERLDLLQQKSMSIPAPVNQEESALKPHPMTLLQLTSGVWLGDSIVRDLPTVRSTPKGFGVASSPPVGAEPKKEFANFELGVQKTAWQWHWDFADSIRQQHDVGKAMGSPMAPELSQSLSGTVCVNEGLSRRIPKEQRMVYMDWNNGDYVGFMLGNVSIQLPRYITFDDPTAKRKKPFFTELCVFQSSGTLDSDDESGTLPELCCSKIARVYNYEGRLKQGCTSFYTLKRL